MAGSIERDQIIDQYKIQNLAGQDQFREYYSAYEIETGKHVTLTVLRPEYVEFDLFKEDYLHRTQALTQIRHPNLLTYLDTGLYNGYRPFVTVDAVKGFPLAERLERLARGQEFAHAAYALTLIKQIASGLVLLERLNLFHYQLTPDHVLLRSVTLKNEESIVITDLDIPSKFTAEISEDSEVNPAYLSPEQLAGDPIDGRSHVYSLGVMLHELLCGQVPERPLTPWRNIRSTLSGGSTLAQIRPNLAPETYSLVERSLYKSRRRRTPSLEAFLLDIEKALAAEEALVHAVPADIDPHSRRTFMIPIALLILCIFCGLMAVWYVPGLRNNPAPTEVLASESLPEAVNADETATLPASPTAGPSATPVPSWAPTEQFLRRTSAAGESPTERAPLVTELYETATPEETPLSTMTATPEATIPATATDTPFPTETPQPIFRIVPDSANVRIGPGTIYDVTGYVYQGDGLEILGRSNSEFVWLNIRSENGTQGWVAADVGQLEWDRELMEIEIAATIPPLPTPTMTPTPTNTPIPPTPLPTTPPENTGGGGGGGNSGGGDNGGSSSPRPTPTPAI
ncbi:MAG: protein kinase domain-containing protein [Candidatus Promineifilaceae bacterium]|jgi:serine/threonine-protein kinase